MQSLFNQEEEFQKEKETFKYKFKKFRQKLRPYAIGVIRRTVLKLIDLFLLYLILHYFFNV